MLAYLWAEAAHLWCLLAYLCTPSRRGNAGELGALLAAAEAWDRLRYCNRKVTA